MTDVYLICNLSTNSKINEKKRKIKCKNVLLYKENKIIIIWIDCEIRNSNLCPFNAQSQCHDSSHYYYNITLLDFGIKKRRGKKFHPSRQSWDFSSLLCRCHRSMAHAYRQTEKNVFNILCSANTFHHIHTQNLQVYAVCARVAATLQWFQKCRFTWIGILVLYIHWFNIQSCRRSSWIMFDCYAINMNRMKKRKREKK